MPRSIEMNGGFRKKRTDEEKQLMIKLQIAMIVCGSAMMLTGFITLYMQIYSSGLHPYWTAWMIAIALTCAGLGFAGWLRSWESRH